MHGETLQPPKYVEEQLIANKSPFVAASWSGFYLLIWGLTVIGNGLIQRFSGFTKFLEFYFESVATDRMSERKLWEKKTTCIMDFCTLLLYWYVRLYYFTL